MLSLVHSDLLMMEVQWYNETKIFGKNIAQSGKNFNYAHVLGGELMPFGEVILGEGKEPDLFLRNHMNLID